MLAKAMKAGAFRSRYQGKGIDFAGVREYLAGDDVRAIDWNVTARLGKPYVKLFEEERELPVFLVVDCSRSMCAPRARQDCAFETAALLALAAEHNNSPSGALLFDSAVRRTLPPAQGRGHAMLLLSCFDGAAALSPASRPAGSALDKALRGALQVLRRRSLVFVLSDFRAAGWEQPLSLLSLRHDVAALVLEDPLDAALPKVGLVPFRDNETGTLLRLPTRDAGFRDEWQNAWQTRRTAQREAFTRNRAAPLFISTADDPAVKLQTWFSA
jgi:uncharacterized protein (DUF58 family)